MNLEKNEGKSRAGSCKKYALFEDRFTVSHFTVMLKSVIKYMTLPTVIPLWCSVVIYLWLSVLCW